MNWHLSNIIEMYSLSSQTKDYNIGKNTALRSKNKNWSSENNVSEWNDISTHRLLFQWASTIKKILLKCFGLVTKQTSSTRRNLTCYHDFTEKSKVFQDTFIRPGVPPVCLLYLSKLSPKISLIVSNIVEQLLNNPTLFYLTRQKWVLSMSEWVINGGFKRHVSNFSVKSW
jgi:hypothetical protein